MASFTEFLDKKKSSESEGFDTSFQAWLDRIMRTNYASANVADRLVSGKPEEAVDAFVKGITGEEKGSYRMVAEKLDLPAPFWFGLAGDIALDPLTYVPIGNLMAKGGKSAFKAMPKSAQTALKTAGTAIRESDIVQGVGKAISTKFRPKGVSTVDWDVFLKAREAGNNAFEDAFFKSTKFSSDLADKMSKLLKDGKIKQEDLVKIIGNVERGGKVYDVPEAAKGVIDDLSKYFDDINTRYKSVTGKTISNEEYKYFTRVLADQTKEKFGSLAFNEKTASDIARKYYKFTDNSTGKSFVGDYKKLGLQKISNKESLDIEGGLIEKLNAIKNSKSIKNLNEIALTKEDALKQLDEINEILEFRHNESKRLFDKAGNIFSKVYEKEFKVLKSKKDMLELLAGKKTDEVKRILNSKNYKQIQSRLGKSQEELKKFLSSMNSVDKDYWIKNKNIFFDPKNKNVLTASQADLVEIQKSLPDVFSTDVPNISYTAGRRMAKKEAAKTFYDQIASIGIDDATDGYKPISDVIKNADEVAPQLKGKYFHPEIAEKIGEINKVFTEDEVLKGFLDTHDKILNLWKKWTLGVFPSYHSRNILGNIWNNYLGGVHSPGPYIQATKIQTKLAQKGVLSAKEKAIVEAAEKLGVLNRGWYAKEVTLNTPENAFDVFQKLGAVPEKAMKALGQPIENNARLAHFIDKVNKKMSYAEAASSVKKYLFDYGDLTSFEKNVLRRVMPFYTWTRKNLPLQLEALLTKTGKVTPVEKLRRAMNEEYGNPPEELIPSWMKERMPMVVGRKGDRVSYVPLEGLIPYADLGKLGRPQEIPEELASPLIKTPIELSQNRSWFFESPIEDYKGEREEFLRVDLPAKVAYVGKQIRLLNELHRIVGYKNQSKDAPAQASSKEKLLRSLTGIKAYPYDIRKSARAKIWEIQKNVKDLKIGLNKANKYGRKEESKRIESTLDELQKQIKELRKKYKVED